jgi:hypothetical protein
MRRSVELVRKITFRLALAYSIVTATYVLIVLAPKPFALSEEPPDKMTLFYSLPNFLDLRWSLFDHCDVVSPEEAKKAGEDYARLLAGSPPTKPGGGVDYARTPYPECLDYYQALANWYEQTPRNWRTGAYWSKLANALATFLIPAWVAWGVVRWAIIAPLR